MTTKIISRGGVYRISTTNKTLGGVETSTPGFLVNIPLK
jgi:hypothetical protein